MSHEDDAYEKQKNTDTHDSMHIHVHVHILQFYVHLYNFVGRIFVLHVRFKVSQGCAKTDCITCM